MSRRATQTRARLRAGAQAGDVGAVADRSTNPNASAANAITGQGSPSTIAATTNAAPAASDASDT